MAIVNSNINIAPNTQDFPPSTPLLGEARIAMNQNDFASSIKAGGFVGKDFPTPAPRFAANTTAFSPDGKFLAGGGNSTPNFGIYDLSTNAPIKIADPTVLPQGTVYRITFSHDGKFLAVYHGTSPYLTIYNMNTGNPVKTTTPSSLPGTSFAALVFSPDSNFLAVLSSGSPYLAVYDMSSGSAIKTANPSTYPTGSASIAAFSPDGKFLAVAHSTSPFLTIYNMSTGNPVKFPNPTPLLTKTPNCLSFLPNNKFLMVGLSQSLTAIYDISSGTPTRVPEPTFLPRSSVSRFMVIPNSERMIVMFDYAPNIEIYDISNEIPIKLEAVTIPYPATGAYLDFSSDGEIIAITAGTSSRTLNLYDTHTGAPLEPNSQIQSSLGNITAVFFSPDNKFLAIGCSDSPYIMLYDVVSKDTIYPVTITDVGFLSKAVTFKGFGFTREALNKGDIGVIDIIAEDIPK